MHIVKPRNMSFINGFLCSKIIGGGGVIIPSAEFLMAITYYNYEDGNVLKSINNGSSWDIVYPLSPNYGYEQIATSSNGKYQIITNNASDDGFPVSVDYGESWNILFGGETRRFHNPIMSYDGKYQIVLADFQTPFSVPRMKKSSDYGNTWSETTNMIGLQYYAMSGDGRVQVKSYSSASGGPSSGLYVSTDYGANFSMSLPAIGIRYPVSLGLSETGQYIYASIQQTGAGRIYRSNDYGNSWNFITMSSTFTSSGNSVTRVSSNGKYVMMMGDFHDLYQSDDYGVSFTIESYFDSNWSSDANIMSLDGSKRWMATMADYSSGYVGIYHSTDYGINWTQISPDSHYYYQLALGTGV